MSEPDFIKTSVGADMSHSNWPELRALSEAERATMIFNLLEWQLAIINTLLLCKPDLTLFPTRIEEMQQHLDRIKALVMSRGKNDPTA